MSTKLHELLAVEGNLKTQAEKTRAELMSTFEKKQHHFSQKKVTFQSNKEGEDPVVESQLDLQTSVPRELKWVSEFLVKALDVSNQVAEANTIARGDVVLDDGRTLLSQVPVTTLLELEKRANELRDFIISIPTLDPAKGFQLDADAGADVYKARDERKSRTKKEQKALVMYPATDKHPAQVQLVTEDVVTGTILTMEWSGLITTADKGDMLSRAEDLLRAVKRGRSRANETEIQKSGNKVGAEIVGYVFGKHVK